jgi:hypothetical protein
VSGEAHGLRLQAYCDVRLMHNRSGFGRFAGSTHIQFIHKGRSTRRVDSARGELGRLVATTMTSQSRDGNSDTWPCKQYRVLPVCAGGDVRSRQRETMALLELPIRRAAAMKDPGQGGFVCSDVAGLCFYLRESL